MSEDNKNGLFTFFFPDARVLSNDEINALPTDKKATVDADKNRGVWLEINCPDQSCINADGKITIQAAGASEPQKKGLWLNLFCPEGSCELKESTDIP